MFDLLFLCIFSFSLGGVISSTYSNSSDSFNILRLDIREISKYRPASQICKGGKGGMHCSFTAEHMSRPCMFPRHLESRRPFNGFNATATIATNSTSTFQMAITEAKSTSTWSVMPYLLTDVPSVFPSSGCPGAHQGGHLCNRHVPIDENLVRRQHRWNPLWNMWHRNLTAMHPLIQNTKTSMTSTESVSKPVETRCVRGHRGARLCLRDERIVEPTLTKTAVFGSELNARQILPSVQPTPSPSSSSSTYVSRYRVELVGGRSGEPYARGFDITLIVIILLIIIAQGGVIGWLLWSKRAEKKDRATERQRTRITNAE